MSQNGTCYIVGAGEFYDRSFTPGEGDLVIAADGGFGTLSDRGTAMDLVVGDFDSMGFRPDHPNVGDLPVDHTLANLQGLVWISRRGGRGFLVGENWTAAAITDGEMTFSNRHRGFLSVFCQGDRAEGVTLEGLKYPLKDAVLTCDFPLGVSNEFTGAESRAAVRKGTLLLVWYD